MTKKEKIERQLNYSYPNDNIFIPEFTWKYLKLNYIEQVLYGEMFTNKYINRPIKFYSKRYRKDPKTLSKYLNNLVKNDIVAVRVVKGKGSIVRKVYTHCYGWEGRLNNEEINTNLDLGVKDLEWTISEENS